MIKEEARPMAKVTATDGNGNDVPVIQAQFNNRGEVESFLTQIGNHQQWVHARDYHVEVDEAGDQPDITPGIMTKTATIKPNEVVKKDAELVPPADPAEPAVPSEPAPGEPLDPGIISEGDLDGPVPTAPILDLPPEPTAPVEPTTPAPVEPVTPPAAPPVEPAVSNSTAKPKPVKPTKPATK